MNTVRLTGAESFCKEEGDRIAGFLGKEKVEKDTGSMKSKDIHGKYPDSFIRYINIRE